jgi:hypothetical protein
MVASDNEDVEILVWMFLCDAFQREHSGIK